MERYAFSLLATKIIIERFNRYQHNVHLLGFVEAVSRYEAEGKAMKICQKRFPQKEGWKDHSAVVQIATAELSNADYDYPAYQLGEYK